MTAIERQRMTRMIFGVVAMFGLLIVPCAQSQEEILILQSAADRQPIACADRDVVIRADDQRYSLAGKCRSLILEGDRNIVSIELVSGAMLTVSGSQNLIYWTGRFGAPSIVDAGSGNRITPLGDGTTGR
ncbi:DUF3060 domain-containing protein [Inquilinus sp. OTU3971]|uniref:DUF3060 domain-containing protein n=1 Tax=Inquilinus sp. OTU3971 TaxID=3043855 RepID=UPI00313A7D00